MSEEFKEVPSVVKHEKPQEDQFSSINFELDSVVQYKKTMDAKREEEKFELLPFLSRFCVFLLHSIAQIILVIFLGAFMVIAPCLADSVSTMITMAFCLTCYISILWSIMCIFFFKEEDTNLYQFQKDGLFFYLTSLIVLSYLRTCKKKIVSLYDAFDIFEDRFLNSVIFTSTEESVECESYMLDYENRQINLPASSITQGYRSFSLKPAEETSVRLTPASSLASNFKEIQFKLNYVVILLVVEFIKTLFTFGYLYKQGYNFSLSQDIQLVSILLVYTITTFTLVQLLGNADIQRKYNANRQLNNFIDFSDVYIDTLETKIDITCPISMETWDNMRKAVLLKEIDDIQIYELSYFCLFFYYIFSIVVCLSSYFELYWILSSESQLLTPVNVIMNTFTFIFLSFFLLFRFYEGSKFNETFDEFEMNIDNLIDTIDDLQTMYSDIFQKEIDSRLYKPSSLKSSTHRYIIDKIRQQSHQIIKQKVVFFDKIYDLSEKNSLRLKIINSTKTSLKKVKRSIQTDAKAYKYRFLNYIEVDFNSTLTTILIALVTTLPTIVPKFIGFYTNPKQAEPL